MATRRSEDTNGVDVQWETAERSDALLSDTGTDDFDQSPQVLEVPELTPDLLRDMEQQVAQEPSAPSQPQAPAQRGEPGSLVVCEICEKNVRVKRDGELSKHTCTPVARRGNRWDNLPAPKPAPKKVRDFSIAILAWTVEEGSAQVLSRATGVPAGEIPTELPDAEEMIGPPLDVLWPNIPDSAQAFISAIADNSLLISCALAWAEWVKNLTTWTREMRAYQHSLYEQEGQHGNGASQFAGQDGGRLVEFRPAQP